MHINVRDILIESVGYRRFYTIAGEAPDLHEIIRTAPVEGEISISRLDDSLLLQGNVATEIQLECHRCLRTFTRPVKVDLSQEFAEKPSDEQRPIEDDSIDIAPVVEEEIILSLPIKILCRPDCPGLCVECGQELQLGTCACTSDDGPVSDNPALSRLGELLKSQLQPGT